MYEQGRREPDFNILKKTSIYFNVSIDSLIGISDCNKNCNIGYRISELLEKQGITQRDLAKMVNVTETTISRYINNFREPKGSILNDIAVALNVSSDYLLGRNNNVMEGIKIPVLGRVIAGIPIEAVQDIISYEEIPKEMTKTGDFFALQVSGRSMEPRMVEGDIVIVKKQPDIESGEIAIVLINGCDATIKRVIKQDNGLLLIANNQDVYQPKFYSARDIQDLPVTIIGKVVELRGKF